MSKVTTYDVGETPPQQRRPAEAPPPKNEPALEGDTVLDDVVACPICGYWKGHGDGGCSQA